MFKINANTVNKIRKMIQTHYKETNTGLSTTKIAKDLCGDEKYVPCINFVLTQNLSDEIEVGQGIGCYPKGAKVTRTRVRHIELPDETFTNKVKEFVLTHLSNTGSSVSVKRLLLEAYKVNVIELNEESKFRASISNLLSSKSSDFELTSTGDCRMRKDQTTQPSV